MTLYHQEGSNWPLPVTFLESPLSVCEMDYGFLSFKHHDFITLNNEWWEDHSSLSHCFSCFYHKATSFPNTGSPTEDSHQPEVGKQPTLGRFFPGKGDGGATVVCG